MKHLLLFLALAVMGNPITASAAPFRHKPIAKPVAPAVAPAVAEPAPLPEPETPRFTVNPDGSVTRSRQADAELKDWLTGILNENAKNGQRAADAEASEQRVREMLGRAISIADDLQNAVNVVTDDRNAQAKLKDKANDDRDEAIRAKDVEHKARVAADAHVSRIKTWLSFALAAVLVLLVQHLPFGLLMPPTSLYARIGASVAATVLAWIIVARFV